MTSRRNYPLLLAGQFLGAFGDNFLLAAILGPLTYQLKTGKVDATFVSAQNTNFSAVFFIPFILLAPLAGFLNDRMPKTTWLAGGNAIKFIGALVGLTGIMLYGQDLSQSSHWQLLGYAIVGIGACFYSPAKYGILPEVVPAERLVKANGTVEMLTLVAIIGGLGGGAVLYDKVLDLKPCYYAALSLYGVAFVLNSVMVRTPFDASVRLAGSTSAFFKNLKGLLSQRRLCRIIVGCGAFWFVGAFLRNNLQGWGLDVFNAAGIINVNNEKLALLKLGMVLGIVGGSILAGQLHKLGDLSWTRRYGLFMAGSILLMGLLGGSLGIVAAFLLLVSAGVFSGLMLVPLNASLQSETDQSKLGKTVAVQNFTDYLSMLIGSGFLWLLTRFGLSPGAMFIGLSIAMVAIAISLGLNNKK